MALGGSTFSLAGTAVSDIFAGFGDLKEADAYSQAADLARENVRFTKESTAIKNFQATRESFLDIGREKASIASSGFAASGSGLDIIADARRQFGLLHQQISFQGAIQEESYAKQAQSYDTMASAAKTAATGSFIAGGLAAAGAVATLFTAGA